MHANNYPTKTFSGVVIGTHVIVYIKYQLLNSTGVQWVTLAKQ